MHFICLMSSLMDMCSWLKDTVIQTSHLHVARRPAEQPDIVKPVETRDFRTSRSCAFLLTAGNNVGNLSVQSLVAFAQIGFRRIHWK